MIIPIGKYKNEELSDVYEKDPKYCFWLYDITNDEELKNELTNKLKDYKYIFQSGKYKDLSIDEVYNKDIKGKQYLLFLKDKVKDSNRFLFNIINFKFLN